MNAHDSSKIVIDLRAAIKDYTLTIADYIAQCEYIDEQIEAIKTHTRTKIRTLLAKKREFNQTIKFYTREKVAAIKQLDSYKNLKEDKNE
ncbi:MAG: hypothetical protein ACTSQI_07700 [Candidatus Helarchaeota archaeon]